MVLPFAAALGEMLVTCGDHMEPQLHSFKKFSEELGKLLRGSLPLWAKASQECRCTPRHVPIYRHWIQLRSGFGGISPELTNEATRQGGDLSD